MRTGTRREWVLSLTVAGAAVWAAGCESAPKQAAETPVEAPAGAVEPLTEAERYAQRIAAAMAGEHGVANQAVPDVKWIEPGSPVPDTMIEPGRAPEPAPVVVAAKVEPGVVEEVVAMPATPAAMSRDEAFARVREVIAGGGDAAMRKALDAATLSVLDPAGGFDRVALEPLGYEDRDVVERYLQAVAMMYTEAAKGESQLDRMAIDAKLDELFGHQPVEIRRVELCRKVAGYGVFEPFEGKTFLAGREHKAIVYVELDNFRPRETENGYEVRLRQEVALYSEADGLAVWRNEPVEISDESRNRRRDFFVVQLVSMPARMTVGKFRLKVSITDLHGGSVDETTVPVEFVADQALVKK